MISSDSSCYKYIITFRTYNIDMITVRTFSACINHGHRTVSKLLDKMCGLILIRDKDRYWYHHY